MRHLQNLEAFNVASASNNCYISALLSSSSSFESMEICSLFSIFLYSFENTKHAWNSTRNWKVGFYLLMFWFFSAKIILPELICLYCMTISIPELWLQSSLPNMTVIVNTAAYLSHFLNYLKAKSRPLWRSPFYCTYHTGSDLLAALNLKPLISCLFFTLM